ncbi:MAG: 1-acyl-sn-glycerol-3-phosphate acyltransferase [Clostridia bacterium]|nr:1-acyl-sn-glycerol-3-phosphate acyltransferase [Clostridia bacterium]
MKNIIPVFFAVDDNYIDYLKVALASIIDNANDKSYSYNFYVLHNGLSKESRKKLSELKSRRFRIIFSYVGNTLDQVFNRFKLRDYYTITTYYRILIPDTFVFIDKALYLDSDIVVLDDLSKLYNTDLGDNLLGAVSDASVQLFDEFMLYASKALNIEKEYYFNAGVLIMNLKKMRTTHMLRRIIELSRTTAFKVAQDQDLLNVICRDSVTYLPRSWNVMPVGEYSSDLSLIHYNLIYKPWKYRNTMYQEHFWHYARKLGLEKKFLDYRDNIPEESLKNEEEGMNNLKKLCVYEAEKPENYEKCVNVNDEGIDFSLSIERAEIYNKIEQLEKEGKFDQDVENDPPYVRLRPGDVDYCHKKLRTKVRGRVYNWYSFKYFNRQIKKGNIVIDGYTGVENLKNLKTGAIVTANHFNPFDSIPIHKAVKKYHYRKVLFKIIKEGNFTFPGLYGRFMRYCNTLPLANNYELMKEMMSSVDFWLKKGNCILIYPEQSMWWNYRKPKPTKSGAFRFAAMYNFPILPTFITMRKTDRLNAEGDAIQAYTLHILKPIYPKVELNLKENIAYLQSAHDEAWKKVYEDTYGVPLKYTCDE